MRAFFSVLILVAAGFDLQGQAKKAPPEWNVFVGTYTKPQKSKGIYAWRFQPATGKLTSLGLAVETTSPSYLAVHPSLRFIYAVNEVGQGTVVKMYFPRSTAASAAAPPARRTAAAGGSERILVVEDEDAVRAIVGEQLRAWATT